jgi:hypothetical protein
MVCAIILTGQGRGEEANVVFSEAAAFVSERYKARMVNISLAEKAATGKTLKIDKHRFKNL